MKRVLTILLLLSFVIICSQASALEANNVLIKVLANPGDNITKTLSISSEEGGEVSLKVLGLSNIVTLGESSFVLMKGEKKEVDVVFHSSNLKPGVYVGSAVMTSGEDVQKVPLILEVESKDTFFDIGIDVPPQYSTIMPGEKILTQVKIYDLTSGGTSDGLGSTRVNVEYVVYSLEGNIVSSEEETISLDKQTQLTKSTSFPENTPEGDYIIAGIVSYKNSVGVSSSMFSISKDNSASMIDWFSGVNGQFVIIILIILGVFVAIVSMFLYLLRDRDKMLIELRKYNEEEFSRQRRLLASQERTLSSKVKSSNEKKLIQKEITRKLAMLKAKQQKREVEYHKLREKGDEDAIKKKIYEWKKEGYNTSGLDYKVGNLSNREMKTILDKWKRDYSEGYKNKK